MDFRNTYDDDDGDDDHSMCGTRNCNLLNPYQDV